MHGSQRVIQNRRLTFSGARHPSPTVAAANSPTRDLTPAPVRALGERDVETPDVVDAPTDIVGRAQHPSPLCLPLFKSCWVVFTDLYPAFLSLLSLFTCILLLVHCLDIQYTIAL